MEIEDPIRGSEITVYCYFISRILQGSFTEILMKRMSLTIKLFERL